MTLLIVCECGTIVRGEDESQLIAQGREHMRSNHPAVAEQITDEQLLALSEEEPAARPVEH